MNLTPQEKIVLMKSAQAWQLDKTGWIPYKGGELPLQSGLVTMVTSLFIRNLVEIDVMWGQGWYRVNIIGLLNEKTS